MSTSGDAVEPHSTPESISVDNGDYRNTFLDGDNGKRQIKTFHVLLTGFGPALNQEVNPSWLAVKQLHNVTITNDQWQEVFGGITPASRNRDIATNASLKSPTPPIGNSPSALNGKRLLGNGDASSTSPLSSSPSVKPNVLASSSRSPSASMDAAKSASTVKVVTPAATLPPLPEPGPYNIHVHALEIPMIYEDVLDIVPGLHLRPPQLPEKVLEGTEPPEQGYDFIFHVGAAGRGSLRMEIIGHKYGYNMKDASGSYCAVVPPISATKNLNNNRGPGAGPQPGPLTLTGQYAGPGGLHAGGFGSMGMGYNNERLGYNPAAQDPQPGLPGSETSIRPMRGFGTAYETFPDEMATDIDVTRLVQDIKASGFLSNISQSIYTSMDAGHYLSDFIYYCSLAESKRSTKALLPYMAPAAHYGSTYGPHSYQTPFPGSSHTPHSGDATSASARTANGSMPTRAPKPARVLLMHCPPVNGPLATEEVAETIRRVIMWVGREMEISDMQEMEALREPDETGATVY